MKKISIYLRATRVLAPIVLIFGGLGGLMSLLALMGVPMETATGKPMSTITALNFLSTSIEIIIAGIIIGAISAIGYSLFDRSNSA